jgi:hypothetical protein
MGQVPRQNPARSTLSAPQIWFEMQFGRPGGGVGIYVANMQRYCGYFVR